MFANLCSDQRDLSKGYQNEHNSVKDTGELPPTNLKILKAFPKTFPTKMKPTKCPAKEKNEAIKTKKKRKERKRKVKVKTAKSLLNAKTISGNLLSAHAQTSQANILHLDQKATKCTTCKWLYAKF